MELYYKDLISEEASLDKLVDDLMLLVQGANDLADAAGAKLAAAQRRELQTRLERLKAACARIREQTLAGVRATDKLLRYYPYSFAGVAFACGLAAGLLGRRRS